MDLPRVAFVFPGQGSQRVGMGADLYDNDSDVRLLFEEADEALGFPLSRFVLKGPEEELRRTEITQPAILLVSVALHRTLGMTAAATAGHSLGEYSALVAAGSLRLRDALRLVHHRGRYMQEAVPEGEGVMLALIGVEIEEVEATLRNEEGPVDIANVNAPGQIVIAGGCEPTKRVARAVKARQVVELPVSAPFHCRLMQPAEDRLARDLDQVEIIDPTVAFYNNVDARRARTAAEVRDGLKRQVTRPVRWTQLIERMVADEGIQTFVEIGPGNVLSGLIRRIDRSAKRLNASDRASVDSTRQELAGG